MISLAGKTAGVTGAARGIGAACSRAFAEHGARVGTADAHADPRAETAQSIADNSGMETLPVPTDVTQEAARAALLDACVDRGGRCDILLNNAGIIEAGSIVDVSTEDFDRVLAVNLRGTFLLGRAVALHMVDRGTQGAILNMSSTNAAVTIPDQLAHATSRRTAGQLTKVLAMELAARDIRAHAIGPDEPLEADEHSERSKDRKAS